MQWSIKLKISIAHVNFTVEYVIFTSLFRQAVIIQNGVLNKIEKSCDQQFAMVCVCFIYAFIHYLHLQQ